MTIWISFRIIRFRDFSGWVSCLDYKIIFYPMKCDTIINFWLTNLMKLLRCFGVSSDRRKIIVPKSVIISTSFDKSLSWHLHKLFITTKRDHYYIYNQEFVIIFIEKILIIVFKGPPTLCHFEMVVVNLPLSNEKTWCETVIPLNCSYVKNGGWWLPFFSLFL
jgi:hypothetical protein